MFEINSPGGLLQIVLRHINVSNITLFLEGSGFRSIVPPLSNIICIQIFKTYLFNKIGTFCDSDQVSHLFFIKLSQSSMEITMCALTKLCNLESTNLQNTRQCRSLEKSRGHLFSHQS